MTTKADIKRVANDAILEGRTEDAIRILSEIMSPERARIEAQPMPVPVVGDILVSAWGYEQTNITFYQVVGVTSQSVRILEMGSRAATDSELLEHGLTQQETTTYMMPMLRVIHGEVPTVKRIKKCNTPGVYLVRINSYSTARLWRGRPQSETKWHYGH